MNTQLALPENKKVIPKPTKDEIITAMVEIARQKFLARKAENEPRLEKARKKASDYAISRLKKEFGSLDLSPSLYTNPRNRTVGESYFGFSLPADEKSKELHAELWEFERIANECWDEKETRRFIKNELNGLTPKAARVQLILEDEASRKHLEEILHKIENPQQAA